MSVKVTGEVEAQRIAQQMANRKHPLQPNSWELFRSMSLVETLRKANELGWKDKKVQVRAETYVYGTEYAIEPWEKDCNCPSILKYEDYYGLED